MTAGHSSATSAMSWPENLWSPCVAICTVGPAYTGERKFTYGVRTVEGASGLATFVPTSLRRWMQVQNHSRVCPLCKAGIDEDQVNC